MVDVSNLIKILCGGTAVRVQGIGTNCLFLTINCPKSKVQIFSTDSKIDNRY